MPCLGMGVQILEAKDTFDVTLFALGPIKLRRGPRELGGGELRTDLINQQFGQMLGLKMSGGLNFEMFQRSHESKLK